MPWQCKVYIFFGKSYTIPEAYVKISPHIIGAQNTPYELTIREMLMFGLQKAMVQITN